jgi:hypothetical protein
MPTEIAGRLGGRSRQERKFAGNRLCAFPCGVRYARRRGIALHAATKGDQQMKMLLSVEMPHEPFNSIIKSGKGGETIGRILESIKPEAAYFTEQDGKRGGIFVVNVQSASDIPSIAEPFFLTFQADCKFRILMSPEDLKIAGLEEIGKKWA